MLLTTAALIGAGLAAAGGAVGGAVNKSKAKKTTNAFYDYAEDFANTQRNLSTFDTLGGKSLLKISDSNKLKEIAALNNRAVAGGATMENQLAARQALNENQDKLHMQMLQQDQRRKDSWDNQLLSLKGQRAEYTANNYLQAAQDWNQWGGQMASSLLSLGSTGLLGGMGGLGAGAASAMAAGVNPADVAGSGANVYNAAVANAQVPQANYGSLPTPRDVNKLAPLGKRSS